MSRSSASGARAPDVRAPTDVLSRMMIFFAGTCALADAVLLTTAPHGASRDEQERVDGEQRDDTIIRSWIDAVAPRLREDLGRRVAGRGVRVGDA